MQLWRRISPGMMPGTSATPVSTSQSAFGPSARPPPRVDRAHHKRKTDCSEYVEARARQHVALSTGAGGGGGGKR